jgi:hypothetical protein
MGKSNIQKVKFRNVGRKQQHEVTLFSLGYYCDEIEHSGLAIELINHAYNQALSYLIEKGFEEPHGLFYLTNGKIVKGMDKVPYYPLWGAIEERDKKRGQTGEYLAALIIVYYEQISAITQNLRIR